MVKFPHNTSSDHSGALFRGLSPSLIRAVPAAASTFVAFELTRGKCRTNEFIRKAYQADCIINHDLL
jgi:hypothetical protein